MTYQAEYYENYRGNGNSWLKGLAKRSFFYRAMAKLIFRHQPHTKILVEVGCGIGMFTFVLAEKAPNLQIITGDISEHALTVTTSQLSRFPNVTVRKLDAEALAVSAEVAGAVTAFDVIEHLPNPTLLINEAFRVLEPGGIFVFTTPNPESLGARMKRTPQPPGSDTGADTWFALRDATHINIRPIAEWRILCADAGFQCVSDGTDFWWDTPYFPYVPLVAQKIIFNGSYRLLTRLFAFAPWSLGENYIAVWRKPGNSGHAHGTG